MNRVNSLMTNRVKVGRYLKSLISETNNSFLCQEHNRLGSTHSDGKVAKIGLNSPKTYRVKVRRYF